MFTIGQFQDQNVKNKVSFGPKIKFQGQKLPKKSRICQFLCLNFKKVNQCSQLVSFRIKILKNQVNFGPKIKFQGQKLPKKKKSIFETK